MNDSKSLCSVLGDMLTIKNTGLLFIFLVGYFLYFQWIKDLITLDNITLIASISVMIFVVLWGIGIHFKKECLEDTARDITLLIFALIIAIYIGDNYFNWCIFDIKGGCEKLKDGLNELGSAIFITAFFALSNFLRD